MVKDLTLRDNKHFIVYHRGTKGYKVSVRQPGSAVWTVFASGSLPNPYMKNPVPMKTLSGAPTLVEEVEFSCTSSYGTWCALSYIEFRSTEEIANGQNGKCLHVDGNGNSPNNYANVLIFGCDGSNNKKWEFNGYGQINHIPSGKCLDMGMSISQICVS